VEKKETKNISLKPVQDTLFFFETMIWSSKHQILKGNFQVNNHNNKTNKNLSECYLGVIVLLREAEDLEQYLART
jgi:hypothetical protein